MRYAADHKAQTRARVLREAAAAIRSQGPDRVGVAALMRRAGLTHGGFYAHWPSKDALLADAIDWMFADGATHYFAGADEQDARAVLDRYVAGYLSMTHRDRRDRGCPVPILAGEQHRLPTLARARFAAAVGRLTARLTGLLTRADVDDAHGRATAAVAEMVGAIGLARIADDADAQALLAAARASVRCKLGLDDRPDD